MTGNKLTCVPKNQQLPHRHAEGYLEAAQGAHGREHQPGHSRTKKPSPALMDAKHPQDLLNPQLAAA